jgi:hypothetical protein
MKRKTVLLPSNFGFFCLLVRLFKRCASLTLQKVWVQIQNESLNRDTTVELIHGPDSDGDVSDRAKSDRDKSGMVLYDDVVVVVGDQGLEPRLQLHCSHYTYCTHCFIEVPTVAARFLHVLCDARDLSSERQNLMGDKE